MIRFIQKVYPYTVGVQNAIEETWQALSKLLETDLSYTEIQSKIVKFIDTYCEYKIEYAQARLARNAVSLISKNKHEQIVVMGDTTVFDLLF